MPKARRTPPTMRAKPRRIAVQPKPCISRSPNIAPMWPNMFSGWTSIISPVDGSVARATAMLKDGSADE